MCDRGQTNKWIIQCSYWTKTRLTLSEESISDIRWALSRCYERCDHVLVVVTRVRLYDALKQLVAGSIVDVLGVGHDATEKCRRRRRRRRRRQRYFSQWMWIDSMSCFRHFDKPDRSTDGGRAGMAGMLSSEWMNRPSPSVRRSAVDTDARMYTADWWILSQQSGMQWRQRDVLLM